MNDTTSTEFFKLIKGCVERRCEARLWQWSAKDSLWIDWCLINLEGTHGH